MTESLRRYAALAIYAASALLVALIWSTPVGKALAGQADTLRLEISEGQCHIKSILLDGRHARRDQLRSEGQWKTDSAGEWAHWEGPASLSFDGSRVDLVLAAQPEAGNLTLHVGDETSQLALQATEWEWRRLELAPASMWGSVFALLLAAVILVLMRPWRSGKQAALWLAFVLCAVHSLLWLSSPVGLTADSTGYLDASHALSAGHPHYFPPGYGLLLGLCAAMPGWESTHWVTLLQHCAAVAATLMLFDLLRRLLPTAAAFLAAFIGALNAPTLFASQGAMTESLTASGLIFALWLALDPERRGWRVGVASAIAGVTLLRVIPVLAVGPLLVAAGVARKRLAPTLQAVLVGVGIVLVVVASNFVRSGSFDLTKDKGRHFWNHFVREQKLLDREGPMTKRLLTALGDRSPHDLDWWDVDAALSAEQRRKLGPDYLGAVAWEAARTASLMEHTTFTLGLSTRNLFADATVFMEWRDPVPRAEGRLVAASLSTGLAGGGRLERQATLVHRALWPWAIWIFLTTIVGTFDRRGRALWLSAIWLSVVYMVASSAVEYFNPRYNSAVTQIVYTLGIAWIFRLAAGLTGVVLRRNQAMSADEA